METVGQNPWEKQNHEYKENIQQLIKENQEQYKKMLLLEKEKNELIQENESINNSLLEMDNRLKSKIPKTADFKKRFKNMGQSSLNMVRHTIDNPSKVKSNSKNKNEMPKKPSSIYSNTNSNININNNTTNDTKIKKASLTMTDFRKKK